MENLPRVRIQDTDGKWHKCQPFVATVKRGKAQHSYRYECKGNCS